MTIRNFTAGPAMLPPEVREEAENAIREVDGGLGILECSHRYPFFDHLMTELETDFRELGGISEDYVVLFLQGGATLQFCTLPYVFTAPGDHIDVLHTGFWTRNAMRDAVKYTEVCYAYDGKDNGYSHIPRNNEIKYSENPKYVYYCANNSFLGTEWLVPPANAPAPLVADMSSNFYSKPLILKDHGFIFASAQKNLGIAGCCIVIISRQFLENQRPGMPSMFDYRRLAENRSMLNTPPTFALYVMRRMVAWMKRQGGLEAIERNNIRKARIIRDAIDATHGFFAHSGDPESRSRMNISFRSPSAEMDALFVSEAEKEGLIGLRGHRETGGLRASVFNAFPVEGCEELADFIRSFAQKFG